MIFEERLSLEEVVGRMANRMDERFDRVEKKLDRMARVRDAMDGDKLLDNHDMCMLLGVTKRSLQRYRHKKLIPYYMADNGKCYYKASEIEGFLKQKGKSLP